MQRIFSLNWFFIIFTIGQISYAQDFKLYESKQKAAPVLIFVHGGAWISGDIAEYQNLGKKLSEQNLCVVTVGYRLAPAFKHPIPVQDFSQVLQKVLKLTSKHCDFNKIFLMGHSAGAHIIAFWATENQLGEVKGLIGLEGIYDLPALAKNWPSYPDWFLKKAFGDSGQWVKASPTRLKMKNKAPWLLIYSEADELVDTQQSIQFAKHLESELIGVENLRLTTEKHFEVIEKTADADNPLTKAILKFIKKND